MKSGRLRRFVKTERLEDVGRELLRRLLSTFKDSHGKRLLALPSEDVPDDEFYQTIAHTFRHTDVLHDSVSEALYILDELASIQEMDDLRERFRAQGYDIGPARRTIMEVIVELWLVKQDLVRAVHFDMVLHRLTGYEQFDPVTKPSGSFHYPGDAILPKIADDMRDWFIHHDRGSDILIEHHDIDDEHWFIVKHSEPVSRLTELKDGKSLSRRIHPQKDDVVVYSPSTGGLRINANTGGERKLYRKTFGRHLFGSDAHFCDSAKYTLDPLWEKGEDALKPIPGIQQVVLSEIRFLRGGTPSTIETHKGDNVFASFTARNFRLWPNAKVFKATLMVSFDGDPKPRRFKVSAGNRVQIARECDHVLFDELLRRNGFVTANGNNRKNR